MKSKIKFKRWKNKKEAVYETPAFLKSIGVLQISESGIFMHAGNIFTKVYERERIENAEELLKEQKLIRQLDVTWSILTFSEHLDTWYMQFRLPAESFEKAQEKFDALERELKGILQIDSMVLSRRLAFGFYGIKKCFSENTQGEAIACSLEDAEDWKPYAELAFIEDNTNSFVATKGHFAFLSIYEYPGISKGLKRETLYSVLRGMPGVLGMRSTFEAVTDFAVAQFMQEKYIGYEGVLSKIKRVNPELYCVITEPVETDNRNFFSGSSVFLLYAKEQHELNKAIASFVIKAGDMGCLVHNVCGMQKQLVRDFFLLGSGPERTSRFLPMSQMALLLPASFEEDDRNEQKAAEEADMEEMRKLFFG